MASSLNQVVVSGRLTADPESVNDGSVCRFSIAVNRSVRDGDDGAWREDVSFFNCVAFSGLAKRVLSKLVKGDRVVVMGRLDQSRYEKEGQKRSSVSIVVNQLEADALFRPNDDQQELPTEETAPAAA